MPDPTNVGNNVDSSGDRAAAFSVLRGKMECGREVATPSTESVMSEAGRQSSLVLDGNVGCYLP